MCSTRDTGTTQRQATWAPTLPTACAASVWKKALRSRHSCPISSTGWIAPARATLPYSALSTARVKCAKLRIKQTQHEAYPLERPFNWYV